MQTWRPLSVKKWWSQCLSVAREKKMSTAFRSLGLSLIVDKQCQLYEMVRFNIHKLSSYYPQFAWCANMSPSIFLINLSVNGHLGCFHTLATVNSYYEYESTNTSLRQWLVSFGHIPRSGIAGSDGSTVFNLLSNLLLFSIAATTIYTSPNIVQGLSFLHLLTSICHLWFFYNRHLDYEVMSQCGFELHFPDN